MEKKHCSRRQFVSAMAAATGVGLLTTHARRAQGSPGRPDVPKAWDRHADVVVVGFGAAGAAAAYEAAAAGARVTILDTSTSGGGDTALSGGYVFIGGGTALQEAAGYQESPEQMFVVVRAMGGEGADAGIIRVWCERGPELFDWLTGKIGIEYDSSSLVFGGMEQHAEFRALAPDGIPIPHSHVASGVPPFGGGAPLFSQLSAAALGQPGVRLKGLTKATRLIQDPITGRVVGVAARAVDGSGAFVPGAHEQFFRASRGVVIATGAFSRAPEMMARHNPNLLYFQHFANPNADGSGIRIAQKVGGDVRLMKAFWALAFFAAEPTTSKGILVSEKGSRFVAEDEGYTWLAHYLITEQRAAYLIFDRAALSGAAPDSALTANSVEELTDAINQRDGVGMSPELLRATVEGYNALANEDGVSGRDPAFLKDPQFVLPVTTPPFYAVRHTAAEALGTTAGGLRVNTQTEVLDPDGNPIPGLYACGTCASLTLSDRYTGGGTAIAGALIFGRIAGQRAAVRVAAEAESEFVPSATDESPARSPAAHIGGIESCSRKRDSV